MALRSSAGSRESGESRWLILSSDVSQRALSLVSNLNLILKRSPDFALLSCCRRHPCFESACRAVRSDRVESTYCRVLVELKGCNRVC
jgi:hypothetical protein